MWLLKLVGRSSGILPKAKPLPVSLVPVTLLMPGTATLPSANEVACSGPSRPACGSARPTVRRDWAPSASLVALMKADACKPSRSPFMKVVTPAWRWLAPFTRAAPSVTVWSMKGMPASAYGIGTSG